MIKLKELHLYNFRSWRELHLTDLDSRDLCLIQGDNGSGKSSIRQAIEYLLTDTTSDGLPLEELPFGGNSECKVFCKLQREEDIIEITKYRNNKKFKNHTILSINGDDKLTSTDRRETQKNIEEMLDVGNLSISTIFSQYSLSFAEAKESDRKDVLYKFMSLDKYEKRHSKAKEKCNDIRMNLESKESRIEFLKEEINGIISRVVELEEASKTFEKDRKTKIATFLVEKEGLKLKEIDSLKDEMLKKCRREEIDIEGYQKNKEERNKLFEKKAGVDTEIRILTNQLKEVQNSICPIFKDECDRLTSENSKVEEINKPKLDKLNTESEKLRDKLRALDKKTDKYEVDMARDEAIVQLTQEYAHRIKEIELHNSNIEAVKARIDSRIKEVSLEENLYTEMSNKAKKENIDKLKDIDELKKKNVKLSEEYKYYEYWLRGYSKQGLPNLKVEGMLGELEDEINKYLCQLSPVSVKLSSQSELKSGESREKISYKIHDPDTTVCDYKSYSGGEKQRIKVADMFAIHSLMGQFNFLILDEVLEMSLDRKGCDLIIDLLRLKAEEVDSIFVISHTPQIQDKFSNTMTIEKKDGVSCLLKN